MEQTPSWESNRFSASQEISQILWNPEVHYRIHKIPPPVPTLTHISAVRGRIPLFKHLVNITLTSTPRTSMWPLPLVYPHQNPVCASSIPHTCYVPSPSHSSDLIIRIIFGEVYRSVKTFWVNSFPALVGVCRRLWITQPCVKAFSFIYILF
jgi:hypothetical protein